MTKTIKTSLLSVSEMYEADRKTIESGISGLQLMESAARLLHEKSDIVGHLVKLLFSVVQAITVVTALLLHASYIKEVGMFVLPF